MIVPGTGTRPCWLIPVQIDSVKMMGHAEAMAKKPHHHGNLREALIHAGLKLLAEGGLDALTLRKCAERAGVSHAAPAHHFSGLLGLKVAIVAWGFRTFADTMRAAQSKANSDPRSQLRAICQGYIEFSETHRAIFELMFSPLKKAGNLVDDASAAELRESSRDAYQVLHDACQAFAHGPGGELATETMIWSLVHGYSTLFTDWGAHSGPSGEVADFDDILAQLNLQVAV